MALNFNLTDIINPQPKQKEALDTLFNPDCKYLLYGGAMAGGKSYVLRWASFSFLYYIWLTTGMTKVMAGLFSEDYPTLKDRQISRIEREFPRWLGELKDDKTYGLSFQLAKEYGSGVILLRNLDDPAKYMSTEFAGIFVDELTRNSFQTFQDLRNRLRWPNVNEVKFMGASNPGGIGHGWVKNHFIDKTTGDNEQDRFYYVHANAYDNKYISNTYIKQLESLPDNKRKAYLDGSWDVFEGQYFTVWNRAKHVIPSYIPRVDATIIGGMDWGRVDNFSLHLAELIRVEYEGTHFYRVKVFLEVYGNEKNVKEWTIEIKKQMDFYNLSLQSISWIRADTQIWSKGIDAKSLDIYSQFIQVNEDWRVLKQANKDRIGGWENMQNWLSIAPDGEPYLQFTSNCRNAIRLIPELVHDENKKEDVDQKGENDAADSVRYMLMALKWIGGKVGGVGKTPVPKPMPTVEIDLATGRQVSLNIDKFASAWDKQVRRYGG